MNAQRQSGERLARHRAEVLRSAGGVTTLRVRQGDTSMLPTLRPGSRFAVSCDGADGHRFGDLLLYGEDDYLVVHRVLGRARSAAAGGGPALRTRGDGRALLDPPLDPECVVGRVVAIERRGLWRSLDGRGARIWARLVGAHDLVWGAAAGLARRVGGSPDDASAGGGGLLALVATADRTLLRLGHALLFGPLHPRRRSGPGGRP